MASLDGLAVRRLLRQHDRVFQSLEMPLADKSSNNMQLLESSIAWPLSP